MTYLFVLSHGLNTFKIDMIVSAQKDLIGEQRVNGMAIEF